MRNYIKYYLPMKEEQGAIAIIIGISLAVLLGFVALGVDIGHVMVTRNELQNVADAAALAGARRLGANYENIFYEQQQTYICNPATILPVVQDVAMRNRAGGMNITIDAADVVIGRWDADRRTLTPTLNQPDAVQVTARRDGGMNGPLATFFAGVLGINTVNISTNATAAITAFQSKAGPGWLPIPVGISEAWFRSGDPDRPIKFHPTGTPESCAGWHTYDIRPASASRLRNILNGLRNRTYQSPAVTVGETQFNFIGGTVASAFSNMANLFNTMRVLNDGVLDSDTDPNTWTTSVVVYDKYDCSNPHGSIIINGFAPITIYKVTTSPENTIWAYVKPKCVVKSEYATADRGGDNNFGSRVGIPRLVE